MDKIARIRQEIERRNLANYCGTAEQYEEELLSFLDTLSEEHDKSLDEAAEKRYPSEKLKFDSAFGVFEFDKCKPERDAFKRGAEWMANQGISFEDKVYPTTDWKGDIDGYCIDGTEEVDLMSEAVPKGLFQVGDNVIVQIRKKED